MHKRTVVSMQVLSGLTASKSANRLAVTRARRVMSSSERKRVVIGGSSFAGLTAAFELKKKVGDRHEIVVLDPRPDFTFIPSLIWLPFGGREAKDVIFPLAPVYARKGIRFINEAAETIGRIMIARIRPAMK